MAKEYIKAIASAVLLTQISDYFLVVGVEQAATEIGSEDISWGEHEKPLH